MLAEMRDYLQQRGQATLSDIALHFDISPEVARQMLEIWIRKGKVQRTRATASCGTSCSQCDPAATELYSRWSCPRGAGSAEFTRNSSKEKGGR